MKKIRFTISLKKLNAIVTEDNGAQYIAIPVAKLNPYRYNDDAYFCLDAIESPNSQFGKSHFIKTVAPKGTPIEQINEMTAIIGNGKTYENNGNANQSQDGNGNAFSQLPIRGGVQQGGFIDASEFKDLPF